MAKDSPRANKRNAGDTPSESTTPVSKRAKRLTPENQAAAAESTRKHEANRFAKLDAKKTAKQKKEEARRKSLADLAEKRKKRDGILNKETAKRVALNKKDVAEEAENFTSESPPPKLPEATAPTTARNLGKELQTPTVRAKAHHRPHAQRLLVRRRWKNITMPRTRRQHQHRKILPRLSQERPPLSLAALR